MVATLDPLTAMPAPDGEGACPLTTDELCEMFISFAEMIAGSPLYNYQRKVARGILSSIFDNTGDTVTVLQCRQSGKSQVVSAVCGSLVSLMPLMALMFPNDTRFHLYNEDTGVYLGYKHGFKIGVFGPKKEQADIIYGRMKAFFQSEKAKLLLQELQINFTVANGKTCALSNGSEMTAHTANEGASIEGWGYHLLITDETQKISDNMMTKSILPMGASVNATVVHLGTSAIGKCFFYSAIRQNVRDFAMGAKRCHYEVDYLEAEKENKFYKKYVAKMMRKLGKGSDAFRMSFCNHWILERGQFTTAKQIATVTDKERVLGDLSIPIDLKAKPKRKPPRWEAVIGIDFGKTNDRTWLALGLVDFNNPSYENEIQNENEWRAVVYFKVYIIDFLVFDGDDYESQYIEIRQYLKKLPFKLRRAALDASGCGSSITDRFKAEYPDTDVLEVVFGLSTKDEIYRNLHRAMKEEDIVFPGQTPNDEEAERNLRLFIAEMEDLEKTYSQGKLMVHHPDEPGAHDDAPDAVALCAFCAASSPSTHEVELSASIFS